MPIFQVDYDYEYPLQNRSVSCSVECTAANKQDAKNVAKQLCHLAGGNFYFHNIQEIA